MFNRIVYNSYRKMYNNMAWYENKHDVFACVESG
jgi:hypothetical protein